MALTCSESLWNVFAVTGDMVTEHVIYCPGPWDRQSRLRWAAEEALIRP